ncbi:MAG: flagellar hook capping FlgD N-terminal domain-containing protein [Peptostreptococcales bacterium]|jgi:flagellar basal-body rod modification protein FlgD
MEAIGSTSSTNDYSSNKAALKPSQNQLGSNAFFKILAAQLQYQDPLKGADNTEYIAQMAQFSTLEELQNLNNSFQQMMLRQDLTIAGQMIGNSAAVYSEGELIQGIVEGYIVADSGILIAIDGKEYPLERIVALKKSEEADEGE